MTPRFSYSYLFVVTKLLITFKLLQIQKCVKCSGASSLLSILPLMMSCKFPKGIENQLNQSKICKKPENMSVQSSDCTLQYLQLYYSLVIILKQSPWPVTAKTSLTVVYNSTQLAI